MEERPPDESMRNKVDISRRALQLFSKKLNRYLKAKARDTDFMYFQDFMKWLRREADHVTVIENAGIDTPLTLIAGFKMNENENLKSYMQRMHDRLKTTGSYKNLLIRMILTEANKRYEVDDMLFYTKGNEVSQLLSECEEKWNGKPVSESSIAEDKDIKQIIGMIHSVPRRTTR